jgi:hypothetical protein
VSNFVLLSLSSDLIFYNVIDSSVSLVSSYKDMLPACYYTVCGNSVLGYKILDQILLFRIVIRSRVVPGTK